MCKKPFIKSELMLNVSSKYILCILLPPSIDQVILVKIVSHIFYLKKNYIQSFKLIEYIDIIQIQSRTNKKDESANKLTTVLLIA